MFAPINLRDLIQHYFWTGYQYDDIRLFLAVYHNIDLSKRTLLRRLKDIGLSRRNQPSDLMDVYYAVCRLIRGPGLSSFQMVNYLTFA